MNPTPLVLALYQAGLWSQAWKHRALHSSISVLYVTGSLPWTASRTPQRK